MSDVGFNTNNVPKGNSQAAHPAPSQQSQAKLNVNEAIRAIKTKGEMLTQHEEQIRRIGASVDALDLHALPTLTTQDLAVLTRCCPNLRRLAIKQSKLSPTSMAEIGKFSKLVMLDVGSDLKTISFQDIPLTVEQIGVLVRNCPNVTNVKLKNCNLTNLSVVELAKLAKLESLDISDNDQVTAQSFVSIVKCTALKTLKLKESSSLAGLNAEVSAIFREAKTVGALSDALWDKIREVGPTITELDLHDLPLSLKHLEAFHTYFPNLHHLNLRNCGLTEAHIQAVVKFSKLKNVDLANNPAILNIVKRSEQLAKASIETQPLTERELLQLAYFIEVRLPVEAAKGFSVFTKKAYDLPRSLQYSKQAGGMVYLLANHKIAKIKAQGGMKLISSAAQVCLAKYDQAPLPFVRGLTKKWLGTEDLLQVKQEVMLTKKLAQEIQKRFPQEPLGIVPVHSIRSFTNSNAVPKLSLISPAFDGDYFVFLEKEDKPPLKTLILLASGAARGLNQLHALGYAFGDFKNENCVFKENPVTKVIEDARLIDFGFTFCTQTEAPKHDIGYYATTTYTAPEQFGMIPFKGDSMKADVFAFGVSFYMQFHRMPPPWTDFLQEQMENENPTDLASMQVKVRQSIEETIEKPLLALSQKPILTPDEQFQYLIYQALRLDPAKRIDMETFRKELAKIPL